MRPASGNNNLDCKRLKKPDIINPRIEDSTWGQELLQFQADQKVEWQEYTFQEVVNLVAFESTVAAVDAKYVEELKEDYVGYKNQTIKKLFTHIGTWYVITTKEKLDIKAQFLAPWSDNPEAHVITFARQLDRRQVECEDHGVTITNDDKVDHFVAQMYVCGLFKNKFLDDWEETADNLWRATHPLFTREFYKERRKIECEKSHNNYKSSAVFREAPHLHTLDIPKGGATDTTPYRSFTELMYYAAALEDKSNTQADRIIELEASVDGQTVLTNTTEYAASAVATGTNK